MKFRGNQDASETEIAMKIATAAKGKKMTGIIEKVLAQRFGPQKVSTSGSGPEQR